MLALRQAQAETSLDTILHPAQTRFSGLVNAKFRLAVAADIGALVDLENRSFSSDRISRKIVQAAGRLAVRRCHCRRRRTGAGRLCGRAVQGRQLDGADLFAGRRPGIRVASAASCLQPANGDAAMRGSSVDPARGPRGQCPRHQSLRAHDLFSLRGEPALLCGRRHRAAIRKAGSAAGKLRAPCRNRCSMSFVSPANANRQSRLPRPGVTHANAIGFATHENR